MRRAFPILVVAAAALACGRPAAPPSAGEAAAGLPVLLEFYSDT